MSSIKPSSILDNSKGIFLGKIIKQLNNSKIKLNITAVYSSKQTSQILKKINKIPNIKNKPTIPVSHKISK